MLPLNSLFCYSWIGARCFLLSQILLSDGVKTTSILEHLWSIMMDKQSHDSFHYGTAIMRQNKLRRCLDSSQSKFHLLQDNRCSNIDPKVDFSKLAAAAEACGRCLKVIHAQHACSTHVGWKSQISVAAPETSSPWEQELKNNMLMSANVALWGGRRHLLSLICNSMCGCYYKKH